MKTSRAIALVSLVCAGIAGMALPSEAAPFFGRATNNCGPGYNTGIVPPHVMSRPGYGYNNFFNNGRNLNFKGNAINSQIQNGLRNGSLTQSEVNQLMAQQNRINDLRARLANNGLSLKDRQRLSNDLAKLEANVRRQMTDNQVARRWW